MNEQTLKIPVDYAPGYDLALKIDPERARNYIAHTRIGDPPADSLVEALGNVDGQTFHRLISGAMNGDEEAFREGPRELQEFFDIVEDQPAWATQRNFEAGIRAFHRNSDLMLQGLVGGSLVEGFSSNISRSFVITGRLRENGVRRLRQNNRHVVEIFTPGGLERHGDGWKLSVRIRLVHAQVRWLLTNEYDDWDEDAWGVPLSSAHMGFAASAFSAMSLKHARQLGVRLSREEAESFMLVWLCSLRTMGVPDTILPRDEADALRTFEIGSICEPPPDFESIIMANSLLKAAPLVLGVSDESEKRELLKLAYSVSRALIGDELADSLKFPKRDSKMLLFGARVQTRLNYLMDRLFAGRAQRRRFNNFAMLLSASAFDEEGISYRMPDHVYAERSRQW